MTTNDEDSDELTVEWEIKRIQYLQNIIQTIEDNKFLSDFLLAAYKFYMNKALLYFLNNDSLKNFRKDERIGLKNIQVLTQL